MTTSDELNNIVRFWYDCLKSEAALDQSFGVKSDLSLTSRSTAIYLPSSYDPFMFTSKNLLFPISGEQMKSVVARVSAAGEDLYYGYPLLAYKDKDNNQIRYAPLFVMQLSCDDNFVYRTELYPSLGSKAAEQLGIRSEEAISINDELTKIFEGGHPDTSVDVFSLLSDEVELSFAESIDPESLSLRKNLEGIKAGAVYNRAILFTAEQKLFNLHLLRDLRNLVGKADLGDTALGYLVSSEKEHLPIESVPIMPFMYDPYQLEGVQSILRGGSSVITGPPGTGKSQFISNLIVNLFMQRKKVLFVSHTNDAVEVVNKRIGSHFKHMMMKTGSKSIRSQLGERFNEMTREINEGVVPQKVRLVDIERVWNQIKESSQYIEDTSRLVTESSNLSKDVEFYAQGAGVLNFIKYKYYRWKLFRMLDELDDRTPSVDVESRLLALKSEHVDLSAKYVSGSYLGEIVSAGNYGKLAAYVKSLEQKKSFSSEPDGYSQKYIKDALNAMNVWSCTLKSLGANFPLEAGMFDYVIFDESSQIDLPSAAPALYRARNLVVVGDSNQLTHIAKVNADLESELAKKHRIKDMTSVSYRRTSLFSSVQYKLQGTEKTLLGHYRSNPLIARVFNKVFYGSNLKIYTSAEPVAFDDIKVGVYWIDVKGEAIRSQSGSRSNEAEIDRVVQLFGVIRSRLGSEVSIGITSPYSYQVQRIYKAIEYRYGADGLINTKVLSVHKFQGSEVDVLIFSSVIAAKGSGKSSTWYKNSPEIINVAISRARQLLLIVGDEGYISKTNTALARIAKELREPLDIAGVPQGLPQNYYESKLTNSLKRYAPAHFQVRPQYVLDGRYTIDIALVSGDQKVAVEVDGSQHQLVGGVALLDDLMRDRYLRKVGWQVVRVSAAEVIRGSDLLAESIISQVDLNEKNHPD